MPDPRTGEGFDAPPPEIAYADAPEMLAESAALLRLSAQLHGPQTTPDIERGYWLRRAALADRYALLALAQSPTGNPVVEDAERDAVRSAYKLAEWDRLHPTAVLGPHPPGSIEWDPSQRPYVRQEYHAWKAAEAEMENSRGAH